MNRVAAIYDIHGNLPALEAVLAEVRKAEVETVLVGGDVVPGPMPVECLERLLGLELPVRFIRGNGEATVLAERSGEEGGRKLPDQAREAVRWTAGKLGAEHEAALGSWPSTAGMEIAGLGEVLFCHATPRDEFEIFTRTTPEDRLAPAFEGVTAATVVCGHTHMQFDRRVGERRVLNAGSVGMPFGEPQACWLLLGPRVGLRRTAYDLDAAAALLSATEYPGAEEFARGLREPRSEEEMLALFAKAELK